VENVECFKNDFFFWEVKKKKKERERERERERRGGDGRGLPNRAYISYYVGYITIKPKLKIFL